MLTNCYAAAVRTIETVRLENYRALIAEIERERGHEMKGAELAAALGISAVYVWQLNKGARDSIDSKAARKIEAAASKPEGWLDTDFSLWPFPGIDSARFQNLSTDQQLEIQEVVRRMLMEFEAEKQSKLGGMSASSANLNPKAA